MKAEMKRMNGVWRESLPSYLDEFLWRDRYGGDDAFTNLITHFAMKHRLP